MNMSAVIIYLLKNTAHHHHHHRRTTTDAATMLAPFVFNIFLIVPFAFAASNPKNVILNLTLTVNPLADPWAELSRLAASSVARAHHLKHHHNQPEDKAVGMKTAETPVSPRSSGEYSLTLRFGTPPQPLAFVLDTGSSLVWFRCTPNFRCRNCPLARPRVPSFLPKSSSSARLVGCLNPKCRWIHYRVPANCSTTSACGPYFVLYGSAATGMLSLPGKPPVAGFAVGCSDHEATGVAGLARGRASLPSQLGVGSFSYCLPSHHLDNARGTLILSDQPGGRLAFTPFLKNPARYGAYYYVGLRSITVGGVAVTVTPLRPDGTGGTIVDSGTSFTVVETATHDLLVAEFVRQARGYRRDKAAEERSGLLPCFDVAGRKVVTLPEMALHFDGGAVMTLPLKNYFSFVGRTDSICLTVVASGCGRTVGPAAIVGNFQQQGFYVVYDTVRGRMGFRQKTCHE